MENYTLNDIKTFLKGKGYSWKGEIWGEGLLTHKIKNASELYCRTHPIIQFVLYKDNQTTLQYISVFDTKLIFWQEVGLFSSPLLNAKNFNRHSHFVIQQDYSSEWTDFLASRHNPNLNA